MGAHRADFSSRTRAIIAQRAGYQCSIPACSRLTIGPGSGPDEVADIGIAGHIFSAAPGGPRGTGGLPESARRSAANGIWLCADHGRLVDANRGDAYPPSLLQSWKGLHEARKRLDLGGRRQPFGWLESLTFGDGPGVLSGQEVRFAARNVIIGDNDTGKTALAEIIAGIGKPGHLARYARGPGLTTVVRWYDPEPHELIIQALDGQVRQVLDGRKVPYVARPYRTVLVSSARVHSLDDMARMLDVDTTAMAAILDDLPARIGGVVKAVTRDGADLRLTLDDPAIGRHQVTVGDTASTGLCEIVLAEAAIALAQIHAEVESTVLIFDEILNTFHPAPQAALTRLLLSKTEGFQSVIITHSPAVLMTCDADWLLTRFSSNQHGSGITQDRTVEQEMDEITRDMALTLRQVRVYAEQAGHAVNAETGAVR